MAAALVSDELWNEIEPLLPVHVPSPKGGKPRVPDRACLTGIVFVLRAGLPWRLLPKEMNCGSGVTCWRRLREWTRAGVWPAVLERVRDLLGRAGGIAAGTAIVDSANVRAVFGGRTRDRTPSIAGRRAANGTC